MTIKSKIIDFLMGKDDTINKLSWCCSIRDEKFETYQVLAIQSNIKELQEMLKNGEDVR